MKKGKIAIYDSDLAYGNRLMNFLNEKEEFLLEAIVFSNKDSLQAYLKENKLDILLLGEFVDRIGLPDAKIRYKIVLCEGILIKEEETEPVINKYQSAEQIMREILAFYVSKDVAPTAYRYLPQYRNCEIIGVYSPCGGCGRTTAALCMAQVLGNAKRVLYFNLELFPGIIFGGSREEVSGFSEFIYYLKQRKPNLSMKLQTLIRREGEADLLYPAGHYNDLYALEVQDIQLLLEELYAATAYDVVIFDIGFLSDATMELLEASQVIYMPTSENKQAAEKENAFFRFLEEEGKAYIVDKCKKMKLPFDSCICESESGVHEQGVLAEHIRVTLDF